MFKNIISTAVGVAIGIFFLQPIVALSLIGGVIWLVINRKRLQEALEKTAKASD